MVYSLNILLLLLQTNSSFFSASEVKETADPNMGLCSPEMLGIMIGITFLESFRFLLQQSGETNLCILLYDDQINRGHKSKNKHAIDLVSNSQDDDIRTKN